MNLHSHLIQTAELYGRGVLGIREADVVFSAAKLFFAYGLGNALTFPMSVGATTVLLPSRPTPADVFGVLRDHQPTIFYGVPTLYAALLADASRPERSQLCCTRCFRKRPARTASPPTWPAMHQSAEAVRGRALRGLADEVGGPILPHGLQARQQVELNLGAPFACRLEHSDLPH